MWRYIGIILLVCVPAGCGQVEDVQVAIEQPADQPPNVVFFFADDLGYGDLNSYGGNHIISPNLDRLADEGVRLTDFYVTWNACTPSRGGMLTGRYPQRNGLYDMIRNDQVNYGHRFTEEEYAVSPEMTIGLDRKEVTVAQLLKDAGYATGVFGKWDSGRAKRWLPLQRGFDDFYGFCNTGVDYWTHERYGIHSMYRNNERDRSDQGTYCTDLFRREAVRFVKEHKDEPFFLYVPFNAPHGASNLSKPGVQAPESYVQKYGPLPGDKDAHYNAAVTCMDDAIGDILDLLDDYDLAENTIVLFSSDNGAGPKWRNAPLNGGKSRNWEGGIRVPLIARWPGHIPEKSVSTEFLTMLELLPTLCNVAGATPSSEIILDGFDMMPVLKGEQPSQRTDMFWQRRSDTAARVGNWKWLVQDGEEGLYDLAADIGEQNNLMESRPEKLQELRAAFAAWRKEMDEAEDRGPFRDF
jgi:arylsulfatase A